jgi:biotin carboxyl carrier protein
MRYYVTFPDGAEVPVDVTHLPTGQTRVEVDGKAVATDTMLGPKRAGYLNMLIDGRVVDLQIEGTPPDVGVVVRGHRFYAKVESERMRALAVSRPGAAAGDASVTSPMPGRVLKVLVSEGDAVTAGMPVCVVEAMKMENELCAGQAGRVTKVCVAAGDTVEGGALLVRIEA